MYLIMYSWPSLRRNDVLKECDGGVHARDGVKIEHFSAHSGSASPTIAPSDSDVPASMSTAPFDRLLDEMR